MDSIEHLDAFVTDKLTDIEIDREAMDYLDEDPTVLVLKEKGTYWEPSAIIKAITESKNWAWEGAAHPMEDFVKKIKIVKLITLTKKIKTIKLVILAKNIVSIPIESISASISLLVKSVCDSSSVEFDVVKSIESVENFFPLNMISDFAFLLALNVSISEIGKETLNNKELKMDT